MFVLVLFLTVCCACAAADTEYALEPCSGKIALKEDLYIVLTPDNLSNHPDLVSSIGMSQEDLLADWKARGVQLQAWTKKMDACLEVSVYQDEESARYYDLEQQTRQTRNEYLKLHQGSGRFAQEGFTILTPEWKKQKLGGNFLKFEYKRTVGDKTWRGLARKTVRNGYTVFLDYQVFDRLPRRTDEDSLNKIANTVEFESKEITSMSQSAASGDNTAAYADNSGLIQVSAPPPAQTNVDTFTVEGHTTPGATIIGVAMRMSSDKPHRFTVDSGKSGNFKLKVTLPEEGIWVITLNLEVNGVIVADTSFDHTTQYSKTLLPLTLNSEIPDQLTSDELIISGTTDKGVTIQCIVTNGVSTYDKTVRTNGTGAFRFKVPTAVEADYDITLVLAKKNLNSERRTWHTTRKLTVEDQQARAATKAIHPSYSALVKNLDTYIGQTMVYEAHILEVNQVGDEWIMLTALKKNKNTYSSYMVFTASEDPKLEVGTKVRLYGTCIGAYPLQSEEEVLSYPGFDYLFYE